MMQLKRRSPTLRAKLASALLQMLRPDEAGKLVPVIPYQEAKGLSDEQIIHRFEFDHHPIRHADGGPSVGWNLTPRPKAEHRTKTARIDIPEIAKGKRIRRAVAESNARLAVKGGDADAVNIVRAGRASRPKPKKDWPKRAFPAGRGFKAVTRG